MIYKLIIVCMAMGIILVWIKNYCPDYFAPTLIACSLIVLVFISELAVKFFSFFKNMSSYGIDDEIIVLVLKILAISYLIEFSVGILEDMNLKSFSDKIVLGGKLIILAMIFPVIKQIISVLSGLI